MSQSTKATDSSSRIQEAEKLLSDLKKDISQDEDARKKLLEICRAQVAALESPLEVIWRIMMKMCLPNHDFKLQT